MLWSIWFVSSTKATLRSWWGIYWHVWNFTSQQCTQTWSPFNPRGTDLPYNELKPAWCHYPSHNPPVNPITWNPVHVVNSLLTLNEIIVTQKTDRLLMLISGCVFYQGILLWMNAVCVCVSDGWSWISAWASGAAWCLKWITLTLDSIMSLSRCCELSRTRFWYSGSIEGISFPS